MKIKELLVQVKQERMTFEGSKIQHDVEDVLINNIFSHEGHYASDLHHYLYNEDYTWIYYSECEEVTDDFGVWDCIALVQAYEKNNFGEVHTDLSDSFKVANVMAYICGEWLLGQSEHLQQVEGLLTKKDLVLISREILGFISNNPKWVYDCWNEYVN